MIVMPRRRQVRREERKNDDDLQNGSRVCSPDSRTDEKGPGLHPDEPFAWVECEDVDIAIEVERRLQEDYGHFGDTFGGDQEMSFFVYVYDLSDHFLDD